MHLVMAVVIPSRAMISKILFTIAVIVAVVLFFRVRPRQLPMPSRQLQGKTGPLPWVGLLAAAVILLMLAGAALMLYFDWREAREIVQIRVIDVRSGNLATYEAYRREIEERSFRTTDGRRVHLAETERMESGTSVAR